MIDHLLFHHVNYIYVYIFFGIYIIIMCQSFLRNGLTATTHTHTQSIHDSFIKVVFMGCSGVLLLKAHGSHHNDLI